MKKEVKKQASLLVACILGLGIGLAVGYVSFGGNTNDETDTPQSGASSATVDNNSAKGKIFRAYIEHNYPDWSIASIKPDPMCEGGEAYDVSITNPRGEKKAIILDKDGNFLQSEVDAVIKDAPQPLSSALKAQYSAFSYGDSYEHLTMANGETRYLVDLSASDGKTSELILSASGTTLCQSKPK